MLMTVSHFKKHKKEEFSETMKGAASKNTSKRKRSGNEILIKPKRPISAYNYFFRELREELKSGSSQEKGQGEPGEKLSVEEIGRIIGQRWRELSKNELAKYKEMAKEDYTRYREEIAEFREEELALMCMGYDIRGNEKSQDGAESSVHEYHPDDDSKPSGNKDTDKTWQSNLIQADGDVVNSKTPVDNCSKVAVASRSDDDRKPPAMGHHLRETTQSTQVHLQQTNNIVTALSSLAQEAARVSSNLQMQSTRTAPQLNTLGVATSFDQNANWILQHVQQLGHAREQQRNCTLPSNTDHCFLSMLSNEIFQQRAAIKKRQDALLLEYKLLQIKDGLLEAVISRVGASNTTSLSGSIGNCARATPATETETNLVQALANMKRGLCQSEPMKMNALQALLHSSHPNIASATRPQTGNINDLNQYLQLPQTPSLGMSPIQAMLVQAAQGIPSASASLGNLIEFLHQSHQPVGTDNLSLIARILASEQRADSLTEAAKKKNT